MELYYKDNGITTASLRKREEEKYKFVHYMSKKQVVLTMVEQNYLLDQKFSKMGCTANSMTITY